MSLDFKVLQTSDVEAILDFESKKLAESIIDPTQRMIQAWHSRWRKESLEHYLSLGWSFFAKDNDQIAGYFLAQPLLFFDGQTQSLWVEHLQHNSLQVRDELCELAYRIAREKHFQRVYFPNSNTIPNGIKPFSPEEWNPATSMVKTSKVSS